MSDNTATGTAKGKPLSDFDPEDRENHMIVRSLREAHPENTYILISYRDLGDRVSTRAATAGNRDHIPHALMILLQRYINGEGMEAKPGEPS